MVGAGIVSSPYINPNPAGEARPVQVRIYQLKTDTRFQNASFEEIWKKDADTLKDDLVKVDELPIYPNTRTQVKFERDEAAQFMIVAGLFREPKGKSWFASFEFPPSPGKGQCGVPACSGPDCDAGAGPVSNPQFFIWIDDTRVEDGSEHANDVVGGRVSTVPLPSKAGPSLPNGLPGAPVAPAAPGMPAAPAGPTAPALPPAPSPGVSLP